MNNKNYINLELINDSIETLTSVESLIHNVDLAENFDDIETYFRQVNFEHANCIEYKDSLEIIYNNLNNIKKKINELIDALRSTTKEYNNLDSLTADDLKKLSSIYKNTPASENLSKLTEETTPNLQKSLLTSVDNISNETVSSTSNSNVTVIPKTNITDDTLEKEPFNTIPIGLAIGTTGIAGSVGAVIVNEKYGNSESFELLDDYQESYDDEDDNEIESNSKYNQNINPTPYHALRNMVVIDKLYGNINSDQEDTELILDDYEETDDNYDFDE